MNVLAIIAAGYLLGAVITYGILIDRPKAFDLGDLDEELRATRPDASERQIQDALSLGHKVMSAIAAAVWPLLAVLLLISIPVAIRRNIRTRK